MNNNGIFVTGTDTGVGKTVVAAALVSLFRAGGIDAVPMKPIETGCIPEAGGLVVADLQFCLNMSNLAPSPAEQRLMVPYCFEPACSPHLAAAQANETISVSRIADDYSVLKTEHDLVIVEGAGGILVPINVKETMLDIMVGLSLPVVLVARPWLGTINHTLLSLRELVRAGVPVLGVIFNDSRRSTTTQTLPLQGGGQGGGALLRDEIVSDNKVTIERFGNASVVAHLPFIEGIEAKSHKDFLDAYSPHLPSAKELLERINHA
ncbi:MAG: dethiobiotin synthase [Desulfobacterales bacterium]|nr:dethiobiotin synthase [Desulfobacterales bacterium]